MRQTIWPNHAERWGELDSIELVDVKATEREEEDWVYVWLQLHHDQGDCLSFIAFRPRKKLQLLVLDANQTLCQQGENFMPRSQQHFTPSQPGTNISLTFFDDGQVMLNSSVVDLRFTAQPESAIPK